MADKGSRVTARAVVVIGAREMGRNGHGREFQIVIGRTYFYEGRVSAMGRRCEKTVELTTQRVPWIEGDPATWGEAWYEVFDMAADIHQNIPQSMQVVVDVRGLGEGPAWALEMLARGIGRELGVEVYSVTGPATPAGEWFVQEYGEQLGLWS